MDQPQPSPLDPLFHRMELGLQAIFHPYGFPLRLRSNSELALMAARSWGRFAAREEVRDAPIELQVLVIGSREGEVPGPPAFHARGHVLTVTADREHHGIADFSQGTGMCWVSPRVFEDMDAFRYFYLDALAYCMIAERYLTGIHAGCVSLGGTGVLLCGDSGSGKSCLTYACARRGWSYTTDDGAFLIRGRKDALVTGNPHRIRFRPSAVGLFPELAGRLAVNNPANKPTIEVDTSELPMGELRADTEVRGLVFLRRRAGARATVKTFCREEAYAEMTAMTCYGRDESQREQRESVRALLGLGVVKMEYDGLDEAVDCLETLARGWKTGR